MFLCYVLDLRPEGAILFTEVVEVGLISGKIQHDEEDITWFGFHVTTSEGLRLECATPIKLQVFFCKKQNPLLFFCKTYLVKIPESPRCF